MRVAGIDPSLTATGIALPDGSTVKIASSTHVSTFERLDKIDRTTRSYLSEWSPDLVVIEGIGGAGPGREAAIKTTGLGTVLRLTCWRLGIPVLDVAPNTLKAYATGHGGADKDRMRESYVERLRPVLARSPIDVTHDEIDALWLRDVGRWLDESQFAGPHSEIDPRIVARIRTTARPILEAVRATSRSARS